MEYAFQEIEERWKRYWKENEIYKVSNTSDKPKYYVLDMFPYPSGAGLHVGHPLGYIASDILSRYKRLKGYNVLHPMGFDAFGLPAEQYAMETGQHPAVTTENNIQRYKEQLDNIGFCYDWTREVRTSDPAYYKWTQWIFLQLFHSWYDRIQKKARPISELVAIFEKEGNNNTTCPDDDKVCFDAHAWKGYTEAEKRNVLMQYRLSYLSYAEVWWCEGLGTVLANDEVVNGVSERGSFPVERKQMRQWFLRITEYAERLLDGLETLDWTDAMKEMQRNWIGKSLGAEVKFSLAAGEGEVLVFTTRPDTVFGVDFMVLAPEHPLVDAIITTEQKAEIEKYKDYVKSRSERERLSEVKTVTGAFTGAYVTHPFTRKPIPVWISEYVLAGYGTGAIMAVPAGDDRDHAFAKHFNIPVTNIFGLNYNGEKAYTEKTGTLDNSDFLNGMEASKAIEVAVRAIEDAGIGRKKVNYKMRDAGFSRQRYWGEPFPIVYVNDVPFGVDEPEVAQSQTSVLPVELPMVEHYKPGPEGQGPLANIPDWMDVTGAGTRETNTMPGYAGSSWYFLRYMDPHNDAVFADKAATDYWNQVDVYIGGTEHAVGHLLYSRLWTKVLHDLGKLSFDEPFKKLVNQGMIQGVSQIAYVKKDEYGENEYKIGGNTVIINGRIASTPEPRLQLYSAECIHENNKHQFKPINIPIDVVKINTIDSRKNILDIESARKKYPQRLDVIYISPDAYCYNNIWRSWDQHKQPIEIEPQLFYTESVNEKMSKSKYNVVNPDDIVKEYGADTFRLYEMFLGPLDVSKPWDTKGIEGVHRFLKKLWRLYADEQKGWLVEDTPATEAELRIIHKTIKKVGDDIERFSFNTAVSQFMICVNELTALNCHKRDVLEGLAVIIAPFAPHLAEALWHQFGHESSVLNAFFPAAEEQYLIENTKKYPVAINGKTRTELEFDLNADPSLVEKEVLADETIIKWLEGKTPKKFIYVKGKMINVVV